MCEIRSDADILCAIVIGSVLISMPILRAPFWWAWDVPSPGRRVPGDVHQSPGDRQDQAAGCWGDGRHCTRRGCPGGQRTWLRGLVQGKGESVMCLWVASSRDLHILYVCTC